MLEFHLNLDIGLPTTDENCYVIFLKDVAEGMHLPFVVMTDELRDLSVAFEEGKGAIPPQIKETIKVLRESRYTVEKILIISFSDADGYEVVVEFKSSKGATRTEEFDLLD